MGDKFVFLDFDGTIFNGNKLINHVLYSMFPKKDIKRIIKTNKWGTFRDITKQLHVEFKKNEEIFFERLEKIYKRKNLCCNLKPLRELKNKGYKFIIVSNNKKKVIKSTLEHFKVLDLFFEVHGYEPQKNKTIILKELLKRYKLNPQKTMYVGDFYLDIVSARDAKMITVAISNRCSLSSRKELSENNPDYLIKNFKQLQQLLN